MVLLQAGGGPGWMRVMDRDDLPAGKHPPKHEQRERAYQRGTIHLDRDAESRG
jgi:hypothetical protein